MMFVKVLINFLYATLSSGNLAKFGILQQYTSLMEL